MVVVWFLNLLVFLMVQMHLQTEFGRVLQTSATFLNYVFPDDETSIEVCGQGKNFSALNGRTEMGEVIEAFFTKITVPANQVGATVLIYHD